MSYIHGTSPDEQRRLFLMNEIANARSLREAGVRPGDRALLSLLAWESVPGASLGLAIAWAEGVKPA